MGTRLPVNTWLIPGHGRCELWLGYLLGCLTKIFGFVYVFERQSDNESERGGVQERGREIAYLLFHSLQANNSVGLGQNKEPGIPLGLPSGQQKLKYLGHHPWLLRPVNRKLDPKEEATGLQPTQYGKQVFQATA